MIKTIESSVKAALFYCKKEVGVIGIARNIKILVFYEGVDITEEIQPSISSMTYTDNSKNAVDDLEMDIENLDYRWLNEWYPDENARLLVGIVQTENGKPRFLDLGSFYVDEPTFNNQRLSLKCLALPLDQTIREQVNSVAWEKITLSELLSKIATKHELDYELHCDNVFFDRLDQDRETDLGFLNRVLSETALSLKVTDDKLIVFNDDALIDNDNIDIFNIKDFRIRSFTLKKKNQGIYDKVEVSYYDADKKKHIVETITKEELEKRNEVKHA